ncbi:unnamed protein product, partial [Phaeothamnion confervicola]
MKSNLSNVQLELKKWDRPLLERKTKPVDRDEFERAHKALKAARYAEIKEGGKEIQNMLKETNKVLKCAQSSPDWRAYVDFANNVVVDGLSRLVCSSLEFLLEQVEPESIARKGLLPVLELKLDLVDGEVRFQPAVGRAGGGKAVRDMVHGWVGSFYGAAALSKRLDNDGCYLREVQSDTTVQMLVATLHDALDANDAACEQLRLRYCEHAYLWTTSMEEHFAEFKEAAVVVTPLGQRLTDLRKFEDAVRKYEGVQKAVKKLTSPQDVGWLRVNTQPIKAALAAWSARWVSMFTSHLQATLVDRLAELERFMADVSRGLDTEVPEGADGKATLMRVMKDISEVRKAVDTTQEMFEPLRQTVVLLRQHGVDVSGVTVAGKEVQDYLEEAPMSWDALVKKTFRKKEEILPMQVAEAESLKAELEEFYLAMRDFRNTFRANAPFAFQGEVAAAYAVMDQH